MGFTLGLDIGIASIGAAIIEGQKLKYLGVRTFETASEASDSRKNRSQRRNLARKKWRKKQLKKAFEDFDILTKAEMEQEGYLCYMTDKGNIHPPVDKTVYHLRKRALTEKVTKRELLLCLYNILHARGHFLMETIDFKKDTITFEEYSNRFFEVTDEILRLSDTQEKEISNQVLKPLFDKGIPSKEIKSTVNNLKVEMDDEQIQSLTEIIKLLAGYKTKIKDISEDILFDKEGTVNLNDLKKADELDTVLQEFVELSDLSRIHQTLRNHNYLCEVAVEKLDEFERVIEENGFDSEEYKKAIKEISEKSVSTKNHYRVVRNIENSFPNGLYVKECSAILNKQSEFYPEITTAFIEVCMSIISARIPYFIGPLNPKAKNAWISKKGNFKYSYSYSKENAVDEFASIREWKRRMISHCTYLPEEEALPVGSFLGETFNIINELNILKAVDKNGDDYYLTTEDKIKVFNNLFLKEKEVKYSEIADLLDLQEFGVRKNSAQQQKFNNNYTLYHSTFKAIPSLRVDDIREVLTNSEKINTIEDIILSINLYDEEKSRIEYFEGEPYKYDEAISKKLAGLKSKSFYSYSKKFICESPMNEEGESLLSILFSDNTKDFTNEQMTIITKAKDKDGNHIDYIANKYVRRIQENNGNLDYNLIMNNGSPTMPISRPVVRALNECMKFYNEVIKVYGVPERVVIETARDFPDFQVVKTRTAKTYDRSKKLYENIEKQLKDKWKIYSKLNELEPWSEIEGYVLKNKQKIELYLTQMGIDLLSGKPIKINRLEDYEIDHILPRGFGDDSINDKMLVSKKMNAKKKDRLPLEFISSADNTGDNKIIASDYLKRVNALYDMELISDQKYKMLTMETKELGGFVNQNLVDTRYIIREFMSILRAFNNVHKNDTHIVALKSAYTSLYRKGFYMNKVRNYGDQHHAHDAALLVIADKSLSTYYPNYDSYRTSKDGNSDPFRSYQGFIEAMGNQGDADARDKLNAFIYYAYKKAFNESYKSQTSVLSQVKSTVPYYSVKVEKNYTGQFFDVNPIKNKKGDKKDVLTLLGVNNSKKTFSGINCVAVDFYKYTDSKGNKQHLAVHIPKVIVDADENINKEKYLLLIKEYYKAPEILDENGELKEYYFRFRAYKNDLIYETKSNVLFKFNIGSIVNKKLELKYVNVFSFDDIYDLGRDYAFRFIEKFNLKTKSNPEGVPFDKVDKSELVADIASAYWQLSFNDKKVKRALEMIQDDKTLNAVSDHLAYITLIINRAGTPPTIDGQYLPVINSMLIKGYDDAQYVKLKYSILGIKAFANETKMIIEAPDKVPSHFKKITREKFTWNLKNSDL